MGITVGFFIENFVVDGTKIRLFDFGTEEDVMEGDTYDCNLWEEWEDRELASVEVDNGVLVINMMEE